MLQEINLRHKYTFGESKNYDGFARILIELANEYDSRAAEVRGANDMDTDVADAESKRPEHPDYVEKEYTEQEYIGYEAQLQEELICLGARRGKR